jgi:hypothetical protein
MEKLLNEDGPISMIWLIAPEKWALDHIKTLLKIISVIEIGQKWLELVTILFLPFLPRLNMNIRKDSPMKNESGHSGIKATS